MEPAHGKMHLMIILHEEHGRRFWNCITLDIPTIWLYQGAFCFCVVLVVVGHDKRFLLLIPIAVFP